MIEKTVYEIASGKTYDNKKDALFNEIIQQLLQEFFHCIIANNGVQAAVVEIKNKSDFRFSQEIIDLFQNAVMAFEAIENENKPRTQLISNE